MKLKQNILMTTEEKSALADEAIEMMEEIKDSNNVITMFDTGYKNEPEPATQYNIYVKVPKDIIPTVIAKFKAKGWYVFFDYDRYEVHKRQLGYKGQYV